jgi:hypothetical protein
VETDVDARPSDAINLAVRFQAPIFVAVDVAKTCGERQKPASGALAATRVAVPPVKRLDCALELRMRMALAVTEGRDGDAARLRDEVAALLGGAASAAHAAAAASLMLEVELAVKHERYSDAAKARDHLAVMDTFLQSVAEEDSAA